MGAELFLLGSVLAWILAAAFYEPIIARSGHSLADGATRENRDNVALSPNRTGREVLAMGRRETYEAPEMGAMLKRFARAMVRRAAEGDLEAVSVLAEVHVAFGDAIADGARAAHERGYSWTEIGRELGITRQAARQRFATDDERTGA